MMNKKNMKKIAAAVLTALTLTAPVSVEAHFLSSRQEKEIGNKAVEDFQKEYATFEDPILTHVQNRIAMSCLMLRALSTKVSSTN